MRWFAAIFALCLTAISAPSGAQFVPPFINGVIAHNIQKTVQIPTGTTSFTVPADYGSLVKIVGIGAGGGGAEAAGNSGLGACSGAYSEQTTAASLVPNQIVTVNVPAGGAHGNPGVAGGDVYFCSGTSNCASIAGSAVIMGAKGGPGGNAHGGALCTAAPSGSGIGSTKFSGGVGGQDDTGGQAGGSGAGAAGPHGIGKNAGATSAGGGAHATGGGGGTDGGTNGTDAAGAGGGVGGNNFTGSKVGADGAAGGAGENNGTNGIDGNQFSVTSTGSSVGAGGGCSAAGGSTGTGIAGSPGKYGGGGCGGGGGGSFGTNGSDALLLFIYLTK